MRMVMDMESGNFEVEQSEARPYSTEVLCANWNPAVPMLVEQMRHHEAKVSLPPELAKADVDAFLSRMSVC